MHNGSSSAPAQTGDRLPAPSARLSRRNFVLGVINGSMNQFSGSLVDPGTVLAVFMIDLMPGRYGVLWLGLLTSLINAGWFWPPVLLASRMAVTARRQPYYYVSAGLRIGMAFGLWAAVALVRGGNPVLLFVLICVLQLAQSSAGGIGIIPFFATVTETIPANWRGKFFGARMFIGSALSFGAGAYVTHLLAARGDALWDGYVRLFLLAAIFGSSGWIAWSLAREPEHRVERRRFSTRVQFIRGLRRYHRDANFRRLIRLRVFSGFTMSLAFPFVVPYALHNGLAPKEAAGAFLAANVIGRTASNVIWSHISDTVGNRRVMMIAGFLTLLLPVALLLTPVLPHLPFPWGGTLAPTLQAAYVLLIFLLIGAVGSGMDVGQTNYLLELAPPSKITTYLSFHYAVGVPTSFAPLVGALVIGAGGHYTLGFALTVVLGVAALVNTCNMAEVRGLVRETGEGS